MAAGSGPAGERQEEGYYIDISEGQFSSASIYDAGYAKPGAYDKK
jgi:hypothetical protein